MKKSLIKHPLLFSLILVALTAFAYAPVHAQNAVRIEIKPCFQCPTGTTQEDGTFICPDDDTDGSPDWIPCGVPAINLCSKGKTAVAILDFTVPADAEVVFEGATALRCNRADVDHDTLEGAQPDDTVCRFYTRDLTGLQAKADRNRTEVDATLTVTAGDQSFVGADQVVIFKRGSCKGL